MPLEAVLRFVRALVSARRLIGADICGEYAPLAHTNPFKRIEAQWDQPRREDVTAAHLAANERVNVALLGALAGAPSC